MADPFRIGVCITEGSRLVSSLQERLPDDEVFACGRHEVATHAERADVLIPAIAKITSEALAKPRLKLVHQFGVGLDGVDIPAATAAGVLVANVPSVGTGNAESVAELAIAHLLMLARDIPGAFERFRNRQVGSGLGSCLWESTVAILGYGGIGEEIARRLAGFGCRVLAISRHGPAGSRPRDPRVPLDLHVGAERTAEVLAQADFVVVGAPASPENIGLMGREAFAAIKPGAFVVNIARGPVIDYDALLEALRDGRVAGAGLDVFWDEPFDPDDPLLAENVIPTPHIGGGTKRSFRGIADAVARGIEAVRRGEIPPSCANPEAGTARLQGSR